MATSPRQNESDEVLVGRAAGGNADAFAMLAARHRGALLAPLREIGEPELVEDLTQTALTKAYEAIRAGKRPRAFGSWIATIASNEMISELRRRAPTEPLIDVASPHSTHEQVVLRQELRQLADECKRLSPREREALAADLAGTPPKEIAADEGVSEVAVWSRLHRARRKLRHAIPILLPVALLEALRRTTGRVRDASALATGTTAAGTVAAAVATAAVVAGGLPGGGNELDPGARAAAPGSAMPSPSTTPIVETRGAADAGPRRRARGGSGDRDRRPDRARQSTSPAGESASNPQTAPYREPNPPVDSPAPSRPSQPGPAPIDPPVAIDPPGPPAAPPAPPDPAPPATSCPGPLRCLLDEVVGLLDG